MYLALSLNWHGTITVGKTVKVLGEQRDPESKNYDICRISYDGKTGYVVCIALGN